MSQIWCRAVKPQLLHVGQFSSSCYFISPDAARVSSVINLLEIVRCVPAHYTPKNPQWKLLHVQDLRLDHPWVCNMALALQQWLQADRHAGHSPVLTKSEWSSILMSILATSTKNVFIISCRLALSVIISTHCGTSVSLPQARRAVTKRPSGASAFFGIDFARVEMQDGSQTDLLIFWQMMVSARYDSA